MSCKYFILSKPINKDISYDDENKIIYLNSTSYILPEPNMSYYIQNGLFEKHLIDWAKQFCTKDKNMLDIGAHSGTYTISLAQHCNHVYSFEPQKMTYYSLCGSVALSNIKNVTCLNFGLGSEEQVGTKLLNIVSLDGGGSTLHSSNHTTILASEEIEIKTLDSLNITNIGFIKIDVEENELDVLRFSQDTLKKSNYPKILFESNNTNNNLFSFLNGLQYNINQLSGSGNMFLASNKNEV